MDSEFLTCLKFIEYFPDYLSALSRSLLRFFWTTFVETAVCLVLTIALFEIIQEINNKIIIK